MEKILSSGSFAHNYPIYNRNLSGGLITMKLKLFDKIVLVLLILLSMVFLVGIIYACWSAYFAQDITSYLNRLLTGPIINRVLITAGAVLILFLLLRILFVRKKDKYAPSLQQNEPMTAQKQDTDQIHIRSNEYGESYITKDALLDMIQKGVRANTSVRDSNAAVVSDPQSGQTRVQLEVYPLSDSNLPQLSEELQRDVKQNVEERTGLQLEDVKVIYASSQQSSTQGSSHGRSLR